MVLVSQDTQRLFRATNSLICLSVYLSAWLSDHQQQQRWERVQNAEAQAYCLRPTESEYEH